MCVCVCSLQERLNNIGPEEFIQSFVKYPPETEVRQLPGCALAHGYTSHRRLVVPH